MRDDSCPYCDAVRPRPHVAEPPQSPRRSARTSRPQQRCRPWWSRCRPAAPTRSPPSCRRLPADLGVPIFIVQHMPALFTQHAGRTTGPPGGRHGRRGHRRRAGACPVGCTSRPADATCRWPGPRPTTTCASGSPTIRPRTPAVRPPTCSSGRRPPSTAPRRSPSSSPAWATTGCAAPKPCAPRAATSIAQSEASAVVASMPAAVAAAGLTDAVVPLDGWPPSSSAASRPSAVRR